MKPLLQIFYSTAQTNAQKLSKLLTYLGTHSQPSMWVGENEKKEEDK